MNVIMNLIVVSVDYVVVLIVVVWVVVVSLCLYGCWGGEKPIFEEFWC